MGDQERMSQVFLSTLQNAVFDARAGSMIEIEFASKALSMDELMSHPNFSSIDILDYSMSLECTITYEYHCQAATERLEDLDMQMLLS